MTARKPLTAGEVVAAILAGHLDGDMEQVDRAWIELARARGNAMGWKVTLGDLSVSEEDMTPGDYARLEQLHNIGWREVNPSLSMGQTITVLALHLARRDDLKLSEAVERIESAHVLRDLRYEAVEIPAPLGGTNGTS